LQILRRDLVTITEHLDAAQRRHIDQDATREQ
jgi:hypothetical protein